MLVNFFSIFLSYKRFNDDIHEESLQCGPQNPCIFYVYSGRGNPATFLYIFDLTDEDEVRYAYRTYRRTSSPETWTLATNEEKTKLWKSSSSISVYVKPPANRTLVARGGRVSKKDCPNGTVITSHTIFNYNDFQTEPFAQPPTTFCVIFMQQRGNTTIRNTLPRRDVMKYKISDWNFATIQTGKSASIISGKIPIYLAISLSNTAGAREISIELSNASDTIKDNFEIVDTNIPSLSTVPEDEVGEGEEIDESSPSSTSESSSESSSIIEESSSIIQIATPEPINLKSTPFMTPDETWDGGWNDPQNVIVRGNDIPEIHETHPPLQTEYKKTVVPKVTKIVNITAGTGVIVIVVVLTVINIVRTFHKIKSKQILSSGSNSDFSDNELDVYSSPEYIISDDSPFVLK